MGSGHGGGDYVYGIGNIIPVIMVWRLKYGRHPDYVNSQIRKVIQLFQNTSQVADSISVAVLELIMCMLPIILFYIVCQKHIVKGVTEGAVKG